MTCHGGNFLTGHDDNYVDDGGDFVACCTHLHPYVMNCSLDVFNLVTKVTSLILPN